MSDSDAAKRLMFYAMLAAQFDGQSSTCTCGHRYDTEHDDDGTCLATGCGCGVL